MYYILLSVIILSVFALGKIVKAILVVTILLHTDPLKCNKSYFQKHLLKTDWIQILLSDDVNNAWNCFKKLSVLDSIVPVRQIKLKQRSEPWIDGDILQTIEDSDKAFKMYVKEKTDENFNALKLLRNKV